MLHFQAIIIDKTPSLLPSIWRMAFLNWWFLFSNQRDRVTVDWWPVTPSSKPPSPYVKIDLGIFKYEIKAIRASSWGGMWDEFKIISWRRYQSIFVSVVIAQALDVAARLGIWLDVFGDMNGDHPGVKYYSNNHCLAAHARAIYLGIE